MFISERDANASMVEASAPCAHRPRRRRIARIGGSRRHVGIGEGSQSHICHMEHLFLLHIGGVIDKRAPRDLVAKFAHQLERQLLVDWPAKGGLVALHVDNLGAVDRDAPIEPRRAFMLISQHGDGTARGDGDGDAAIMRGLKCAVDALGDLLLEWDAKDGSIEIERDEVKCSRSPCLIPQQAQSMQWYSAERRGRRTIGVTHENAHSLRCVSAHRVSWIHD